MKSLPKYFLNIRIFDFFTILQACNFGVFIQKCIFDNSSRREYYFKKDFTPLLLESAVMYDDNGIILGSGGKQFEAENNRIASA